LGKIYLFHITQTGVTRGKGGHDSPGADSTVAIFLHKFV